MSIPGGRPTFLELPSGQIRDERRLQQVVNGAMTGKLNAVGDAVVPAASTGVVVDDVRCSEWSWIGLMATNTDALAINTLIVPGDKQFTLGAWDTTPAYGQILRAEADYTWQTTWANITGYTPNANVNNVTLDGPNGTVSPDYAGLYTIDYAFMFTAENIILHEWAIAVNGTPVSIGSWQSSGGERDVIRSLSFQTVLAAGDLISLQMQRPGGSTTKPLYYVLLGLQSIEYHEAVPIDAEATFRYVIIG